MQPLPVRPHPSSSPPVRGVARSLWRDILRLIRASTPAPLGRRAKALYYRNPPLGTIAVLPMVACEALHPVRAPALLDPATISRSPMPITRWALRSFREPSTPAAYYGRAVHFLEVLEEDPLPGYEREALGYPFDWETILGTIKSGTPLITTLPYVYEAFRAVYELDKDEQWRQHHAVDRPARAC